jgi:CBS domain containing-hemolysin-like protein
MVSRTRIMTLAQEGKRRAVWVLRLIDNPSKLLSTILIGNNIVNLSASSLTTILTSQIGGYATGIATGVLTFVILVFGEITPKTMATIRAEQLSLLYSPIILFLFYVLTPIIWFLNIISSGVLWVLRIDKNAKNVMSEKELRLLVDASHKDGVIEKEEKEMINNVFDFGDSKAKDVMTPRVDMVCVDITDSFDYIMALYAEHKYTRMPVYENTPDNIIGILNIKDLLYELSCDHTGFTLHDLLWQPYFTTEFQSTSDLLAIIRNAGSNMAIVLDEYGAPSGLITTEDLLEEIVGELRDEYDKEEENDILKLSDSDYEVDGSIRLDDLNGVLGTTLTSKDYDSIGGHILELLDHLPTVGEIASEHNLIFTVTKMDKNRIQRVHIQMLNNNEEFPS